MTRNNGLLTAIPHLAMGRECEASSALVAYNTSGAKNSISDWVLKLVNSWHCAMPPAEFLRESGTAGAPKSPPPHTHLQLSIIRGFMSGAHLQWCEIFLVNLNAAKILNIPVRRMCVGPDRWIGLCPDQIGRNYPTSAWNMGVWNVWLCDRLSEWSICLLSRLNACVM